ncbi:S-adenosyl-L-methionine-dependent methyltransferase [Phlyctochytrium arcticum]|nr:S-adenosyl-L-methionine-dependent methyltransferase [Phlyctochytrium arcticum]
MHPTPDLPHSSSTYQDVYEPAEDSFLLLDALEKDLDFLADRQPTLVLEIGSGSGIVSTFLASLLQTKKCPVFSMATDLNSKACTTTVKTAQHNSVQIDAVNGHLVAPLADRLQRNVDVLVFNPPYVVTESEEVGSKGIEASWAGGIRGREVTDLLLPLIPQLLSQQGVFYLVAVRENDPEEILAQMRDKYNLCAEILLSRTAGTERLYILKVYRQI